MHVWKVEYLTGGRCWSDYVTFIVVAETKEDVVEPVLKKLADDYSYTKVQASSLDIVDLGDIDKVGNGTVISDTHDYWES